MVEDKGVFTSSMIVNTRVQHFAMTSERLAKIICDGYKPFYFFALVLNKSIVTRKTLHLKYANAFKQLQLLMSLCCVKIVRHLEAAQKFPVRKAQVVKLLP